MVYTLIANQSLLFLCITTALMTTGQGIAVPMVPLFADTFGITSAKIGLAVSAFGLARFITNIPAAFISDRMGRRSVLIGGPIIAAIGNTASGYTASLVPLLFFRFIAGVGSAAFITGGIAFISDISKIENRARMMSVFQVSFLVGISIGPVLGGVIAELFGLRAPFLAIGVVSILSALCTFFWVPETRMLIASEPKTEVAEVEHSTSLLKGYEFLFKKDLLLISLAFAGTFFTRGGAFFTLLPLKGSRTLNMSEGQVGGFLTLPSVFSLFMLPFAGIFSDKYGRKTVIVPGISLFAVSLFALGFSVDWIIFGVGVILYGIAQGLEGPAPVAYVSDVSHVDKQAVAQSFVRSVGDFALFSAPPIMGLMTDLFSIDITLYANAIIMLSIAIIFLVFAREPIQKHTNT